MKNQLKVPLTVLEIKEGTIYTLIHGMTNEDEIEVDVITDATSHVKKVNLISDKFCLLDRGGNQYLMRTGNFADMTLFNATFALKRTMKNKKIISLEFYTNEENDRKVKSKVHKLVKVKGNLPRQGIYRTSL